jgi:hypothetical protein
VGGRRGYLPLVRAEAEAAELGMGSHNPCQRTIIPLSMCHGRLENSDSAQLPTTARFRSHLKVTRCMHMISIECRMHPHLILFRPSRCCSFRRLNSNVNVHRA